MQRTTNPHISETGSKAGFKAKIVNMSLKFKTLSDSLTNTLHDCEALSFQLFFI